MMETMTSCGSDDQYWNLGIGIVAMVGPKLSRMYWWDGLIVFLNLQCNSRIVSTNIAQRTSERSDLHCLAQMY